MDMNPGRELPGDWSEVVLEEIALSIGSGTSKPSPAGGVYPVHGSTGIIGRTSKADYSGESILVARVGANAGMLSRADGFYGVTDNTVIVKLNSGVYLPFIWYLLLGSRLSNLSYGSGQPLITGSQLKQLRFSLPPLPEQRAIAEALSDVDTLIAALDALISKKRAVKTAAMQQLLTGRQRLPGFNEEWRETLLPHATLIRKGSLITSVTLKPGPVPVIAGGMAPAYYHAEANRSQACVTISASGASAGYVAFHREPIFASDCSTVEGTSSVTVEFAYYWLLNNQAVIYGLQSGGAQPHVQPKDLARLTITFPPVEEQKAITTVLSDMDAEIVALVARRDKTRHIKTGMMQELLTGRTRLVPGTL